MKKFKILISVSFLVLALCMCKTSDKDKVAAYPGYQPFPDGFGYMQDTAALAGAVKQGNVAYVRGHAWKLWAGIEQPAENTGWPVWFTWPSTKQAFARQETPQLAAVMAKEMTISLISSNRLHIIRDTIKLPIYPIPGPVKQKYWSVITSDSSNITDGSHFICNGDIMIPTESLSNDGFYWIRNNKLYTQATLDSLYKNGVKQLSAPATHIVTKHMYWPVLAGSLGVVPVWNNDHGPDYTGYAGYETWDSLVAVDPMGAKAGQTATVTYLYGVLKPDGRPWAPITKKALVHKITEFYYHKVTQKDWDSLFDESDKAIINASSYWAYNKPFGPGDYLITVAMHVNTKEIPTWALQSVWWSDKPDEGKYAENRPVLGHVKDTTWKHYLMVDGYGIPDSSGNSLPVAMNPFIELVIHPVATNCNNCHMRAGWPHGKGADSASYQNPDCPDLLSILHPDSHCLQKYMRTDFQWLIPGHALPANGHKGE